MAIGVAGPAFTPRGWARLRDRDVALCVRQQLDADKPFNGVARAQIEGAYVGAVQTQSGLYAVVDRGASLSPMRVAEAPGLQMGAQVALMPGANGVVAGIEAGVGWSGRGEWLAAKSASVQYFRMPARAQTWPRHEAGWRRNLNKSGNLGGELQPRQTGGVCGLFLDGNLQGDAPRSRWTPCGSAGCGAGVPQTRPNQRDAGWLGEGKPSHLYA